LKAKNHIFPILLSPDILAREFPYKYLENVDVTYQGKLESLG